MCNGCQSRSQRGGKGGSCPSLDLLSKTNQVCLWLLSSLDSVILIIVTCNCLPFSYSRSIFRRHLSCQVLKIGVSEPPNLKTQESPTRRLPSALAIMPHPVTKDLATALVMLLNQVFRQKRFNRILSFFGNLNYFLCRYKNV